MYPWSDSNATMMPSGCKHDGISIVIQALSDFHDSLSRRITNDVHFLLEVTTDVGLKDAPPVFPRGFKR